MGAHLVGERRLQVLVERQVVAEVLAGRRRDGQAQSELVGLGLVVAQLDQLVERLGRDRDDRLAGGGATGIGGQRFEWAHAFRLSAGRLPSAREPAAELDRPHTSVIAGRCRSHGGRPTSGGPVDAPVAACPGWDVRPLVEHMAYIHRWADFAVRNAVAAGPGDVAHPGPDADLAAWLRAGGDDAGRRPRRRRSRCPDLAPVPGRARSPGSGRAGRPTRRRCTAGTPRRRRPVRRASTRAWPPTGSPNTSNWPAAHRPARARRTPGRDRPHRLPRRRRRRPRARSCRPAGRRHVAGHRRAGAARADGAGAALGPRDRRRRRGGRRLAVDPRLVSRAGDSGLVTRGHGVPIVGSPP